MFPYLDKSKIHTEFSEDLLLPSMLFGIIFNDPNKSKH